MGGERTGEEKVAVDLEGMSREMARFRQGAYRLLAAWFIYPDRELVEVAPDAAQLLRPYDELAVHLPCWETWDRFLTSLEAVMPGQLGELEQSYQSLFGASSSYGTTISLCESGYATSPEAIAWVVGDLSREYSEAGIAVEVGVPDHAAVELEYVSFRCGQEVDAWETGEQDVRRLLATERRFLDEHLCRWLPAVQGLVAAQPDVRRGDARLYQTVVETARELAVADVDIVSLLLSSAASKE